MVTELGSLLQEKINKKNINLFDDVTFISMQDVSENAIIKNFIRLPYSKIKSGFTYFEKNDVLVAKITPCFENGKGGFACNIPTQVGFGSTEFHILRAKKNVDPRYIYFQTKRDRFRSELAIEMVGSAGHKRIPFSAIQRFKLEVNHNFQEQKLIAKVLADVDALINALEKLISKKQDIKTATMGQLLTGKKRLPPFANNQGDKKTELGMIPQDWEVKNLDSQSLFIISGKTSTDNKGEHILYGSTGKIGMCQHPEYEGYAILVARVGANAGRIYVVSGKYGVSDNTIIIKIKNTSNINYFKYQLIKNNLNSLVFGSGQPLITSSQLKLFCISTPSKKEQTAIAKVLSAMDNEIDMLNKRLAKTQSIKQGMMQQLLTGRVRLV